MVLLVERLGKLYSKLENHHHHHHHQQQQQQAEALSASLQAFRSDVSNCINQCLNLKPGLEVLSLPWILQLFQVLPLINRAFAKLVVDVDYHMCKWRGEFIDEYLSYSLGLLDLLNNISSAISHLGQARILVSHALTLLENSPSSAIDRLKAIEFRNLACKGLQDQKIDEDEKEMSLPDEECLIHQALMELKSIQFWVCSVVLSSLSGDAKAYLDMKKSAGELLRNPSLINLDLTIYGVIMQKGCLLKEVKEMNNTGACLASVMAAGKKTNLSAEETQRKLEVFEKLLDGLQKEVDCLFSDVMAGRNELLDGIRYRRK